MKKSVLFLFAFSFLLCVSCSKDEGSLSVSPSTIDIDYQQCDTSIRITCENTAWEITSASDWVTLTSTKGNLDVRLVVHIAENENTVARSTELIVSGTDAESQTITINQKAKPLPVSINPQNILLKNDGGSAAFTVKSNGTWTITNVPDWLTLSATEGHDSMQITVKASEYTGLCDRTAKLYATDSYGYQDSLSVTQYTPNVCRTFEAVDLALPSGLLWANMNLGATAETEYGTTYQWGEVPGKDYSVISSKYSYEGKRILDLEDDTAYNILGEDWRIPSDDDIVELATYTTRTWSSINGTEGWLLTGGNGNHIFLPIPDGTGSWGRFQTNSLGEGMDEYEWEPHHGAVVVVYGWLPKSWYGYGDYYIFSFETINGFGHNPVRAVKYK